MKHSELIARLEAAEVVGRSLSVEYLVAVGFLDEGDDVTRHSGGWVMQDANRVLVSLDAALALAERVLPPHGQIIIAWGISADIQIDSNDPCSPPLATSFHMSAPIAICIAILKALDNQ